MIEPEDQLQQDDSLDQNDEQMSQQDIHSNGFDETNNDIGETDETDRARQAYDAAESSFTLNLEDDGDEVEED